jgi:hypothetical protein
MDPVTAKTAKTAFDAGRTTVSFVRDLRRWQGERKTTDDVLRRALATELCRGDPQHKEVTKVVVRVIEHFWEGAGDGGFRSRMKTRWAAKRGLLDSRHLDWPRWRDELREAIDGVVSDGDLKHLRSEAYCTEGPSSAQEMVDKFPQFFLEELSNEERWNDYRGALRWRLLKADELHAIGEQDRTSPELRVGLAAAASVAAAAGATQVLSASTVEEVAVAAAIAATGTVLSTMAERRAGGRRVRVAQLHRFVLRWCDDLSDALAREDTPRVEHLREDLSNRLIPRAEGMEDETLSLALLEVEDVLAARSGGGPPSPESGGALALLREAVMDEPEPAEASGAQVALSELPAPEAI